MSFRWRWVLGLALILVAGVVWLTGTRGEKGPRAEITFVGYTNVAGQEQRFAMFSVSNRTRFEFYYWTWITRPQNVEVGQYFTGTLPSLAGHQTTTIMEPDQPCSWHVVLNPMGPFTRWEAFRWWCAHRCSDWNFHKLGRFVQPTCREVEAVLGPKMPPSFEIQNPNPKIQGNSNHKSQTDSGYLSFPTFP